MTPQKTKLSARLKSPWTSPPRPRPSIGYQQADFEKKRRSNFEPLLEDIMEEQPEPLTSPATLSPATGSARNLGGKQSPGDLRLRLKRSARTLAPKAGKFMPQGDDQLPTSGIEHNYTPRTEYHLRGKHSLPAARQERDGATSPWHPHHPFIWASQNLWCAACAPFLRVPEVREQEPRRKAHDSNPNVPAASLQAAVSSTVDAGRDTPLTCALCKGACCKHGYLHLALLATARRTQSAYINKRSRAALDLAEIEASFALGPDAPSFVTCMGDCCARTVCPDCAARCTEPLCGLVLCSACWPAQGGECDLHSMLSEDDGAGDDVIPPMPTRTPPPPPPSRPPPPPPPLQAAAVAAAAAPLPMWARHVGSLPPLGSPPSRPLPPLPVVSGRVARRPVTPFNTP